MTNPEQKILAVVAGVETSSHVLTAAAEHVEQEAASLVVLHVMPEETYERRQHSYATTRNLNSGGYTFTYDQATENAESVAERAAKMALDGPNISYTAVGRVGDPVSPVLAVALTHGCETIFLQETYPWWRRVIGRADRRLAKRFDGTIVRVPRPVSQNLKISRQDPKI